MGPLTRLPAAQVPLACKQPVSPCNYVAALHSDCNKVVVMPSDYPTAAFKVGGCSGWAAADDGLPHLAVAGMWCLMLGMHASCQRVLPSSH